MSPVKEEDDGWKELSGCEEGNLVARLCLQPSWILDGKNEFSKLSYEVFIHLVYHPREIWKNGHLYDCRLVSVNWNVG